MAMVFTTNVVKRALYIRRHSVSGAFPLKSFLSLCLPPPWRQPTRSSPCYNTWNAYNYCRLIQVCTRHYVSVLFHSLQLDLSSAFLINLSLRFGARARHVGTFSGCSTHRWYGIGGSAFDNEVASFSSVVNEGVYINGKNRSKIYSQRLNTGQTCITTWR